MADQRDGGIAWTDETWNPIRGCSRVSEGCRNCYAEKVAGRFSGSGQPYEGLVEIGTKGARWSGAVRFVPEHLEDPLRWKRPRRIFVNSMSDLFHESVPDEQIDQVFAVMLLSPHHTHQVLTKRAHRMRDYFRGHGLYDRILNAADGIRRRRPGLMSIGVSDPTLVSASWIWWGVSVEDQKTADERIPFLLEVPGVRWVSYEPAIGPVDFRAIPYRSDADYFLDTFAGRYSTAPHGHGNIFAHGMSSKRPIDWVVIGGESGPGARPFDIAWARSVIEQTRGTDCKVFVKQLGAAPYEVASAFGADATGYDTNDILACAERPRPPQMRRWTRVHTPDGKTAYYRYPKFADRKGGDMAEWPADLRVREFPKMGGAA